MKSGLTDTRTDTLRTENSKEKIELIERYKAFLPGLYKFNDEFSCVLLFKN